MKNYYVIILLVNFFSLSSQENDLRLNLYKSISEYRSNILVHNIENVELLNETLEQWNILEPNKEELNNFIFQIQYAKEITKWNSKAILRKAPKLYKNSVLARSITESQINSIVQNSQLTDLIAEDILDSKYPYRINNIENLLEEIEFYNISENESIAEIGAGKGVFSILVYMINRKNVIYINELDKNLLTYFQFQLSKGNLNETSSQLFLINGSKKETKIPEKVDKVIVRNTFHHFKKKDEMLGSIKSILKEKGKLYIKESLKDEDDINGCKYKLSEKEIKSALIRNGFKNRRELKIENELVIEYTK